MKIKTTELKLAALDYAVAVAENLDYFQPEYGPSEPEYSTDWSQGGPIIERQELEIEPVRKDKVNGIGIVTGWRAIHPKNYGGLNRFYGYGETPLIAAMRCYVAIKLGDEVEIPDGLI